MASSPVGLSPLQRDVLDAFFALERGFVLTGGGALVGFHLRHRQSDDLDLFTRPPGDLQRAQRSLEAAAQGIGATVEALTTYPEFRRLLVRRNEESTLVDFVIDHTPEVDPTPVEAGSIRFHSLREVAANKVCALLGRCEIRDLVDLKAILEHGVSLEQALADAVRKDAGADPATLAWLLSELRIGAEAIVPGGSNAKDLESFRQDLVRRLRRDALP